MSQHRPQHPTGRRPWLVRTGLMGLMGLGLPGLSTAREALAARAASPQAPRLVSVHGSMTEVAYLLQAQSLLVGTDTTSTHPPAAQHTTKVGYMRQLSAEGLLALRPTAVLGTDEAGPPPVLAQLRQAGVPLRLVEVQHRFDDVLAKVRLVGEAAQRESAAQHLSARLEAEWQATRAALARSPLRAAPRVLFVMAHGGAPMTSGSGTAADAMIALAGGTNALAGVEGYRPLNAESVVQARPDWVLSTDASLAAVGGAERFWALPGLGLTPAARQRRLLAPDAMALLGFGPRMPAALAELHRAFA